MRPDRCTARRRDRPVRLVTEPSKNYPPIVDSLAQAYGVVLEGAELLQSYDSAWFAQHVAPLPITTGTGLGVIAAFWQMVERDICPLRWPWDHSGQFLQEAIGRTPEETLRCFGDAGEEFLIGEVRYYLMEPRPEYHGIGAQSVVSGDDDLPHSSLALLLWHLFEKTPLSLGLAPLEDLDGYSKFALTEITAIRPLPARTPIDRLCHRLEHASIPDFTTTVGADQLIRYAFGATRYELANYSEEEIGEIMLDGHWSWNALGDMREDYLGAQAVATAFWAWSHALEASENRPRALRRIAAWLWSHVRAVRGDRAASPQTLVEIMAREEARAA